MIVGDALGKKSNSVGSDNSSMRIIGFIGDKPEILPYRSTRETTAIRMPVGGLPTTH
jgi:hypothetical protein